jgi:DNA-binding NarL/FixJ family response regulator
MIRVLVVDDQPVVLAGVRTILSAAGGIKIVGEATSLTEAKKLADAVPANVLVLDVRFPDGSGLDLLPRIRRQHPELAVLMYSAHENPRFVARALQGGAAGYLLKGQPPERLVECVKQAASGQGCFTREDVRRTSVALAAPRLEADVAAPLTLRETEVLKHVVAGRTNKEIAQEMKISYETVKEHIQHLLSKIGVTDRTQAAVWAIREKIFEE